jgi:hypothetical protein
MAAPPPAAAIPPEVVVNRLPTPVSCVTAKWSDPVDEDAAVVSPALPVVWATLAREARRNAWAAPGAWGQSSVVRSEPERPADPRASRGGTSAVPTAGRVWQDLDLLGVAVAGVKAVLATASLLLSSTVGLLFVWVGLSRLLGDDSPWAALAPCFLPLGVWLGSAVWLARHAGRGWGWAAVPFWPLVFSHYVYKQNLGRGPVAAQRAGPAAKFPTAATSGAVVVAGLLAALAIGVGMRVDLDREPAREPAAIERDGARGGDTPGGTDTGVPVREIPLLPTQTPEPAGVLRDRHKPLVVPPVP